MAVKVRYMVEATFKYEPSADELEGLREDLEVDLTEGGYEDVRFKARRLDENGDPLPVPRRKRQPLPDSGPMRVLVFDRDLDDWVER